jgi:hypothetical protein
MNPARCQWFPKLSLLLCLLTAHAGLSQGAGDLFRQGADSGACGGFAVPVKPASTQITDRSDLGLESAKTRTGVSALLIPVSSVTAQAHVCSGILADADRPRRPQSALLRVRLGRAPPLNSLQ